ncbi:MAG TPA: response regulator [Opitutus sp.]|nr:response regulator [Opitutus sp.]
MTSSSPAELSVRCLITGSNSTARACFRKELEGIQHGAGDGLILVEETAEIAGALELVREGAASRRPVAIAIFCRDEAPAGADLEQLEAFWRCDPTVQLIVAAGADSGVWRERLRPLAERQPVVVLDPGNAHIDAVQLVRFMAQRWRVDCRMRRHQGRLEEQLAERGVDLERVSDQLQVEMAARQQVIAERVELERLLLESQKLESLGVVASGIAHDFNNLLTAILTNASLLRDDPEISPGALESLDQIQSATLTAAGLCQQMLAYAGKGTFHLAEVDFNLLMRQTVELLRSVVSKKARLEVSLCEGALFASADSTQLKQVVINLVANASDALGDKPGDIRIVTACERHTAAVLEKDYRAAGLPGGTYIHLAVSDNGCGMTPETLTRAFDPFFTTKFIGRGLGLSAVRGIVRGHHGALRVESAVGQGTTFHILLPCIPAAEAMAPTATDSSPRGFKGRILIVDDEAIVRTSAQKILGRQGYVTVLVDNGQQALDVLRSEDGGFDLVLLDLTMPELSGAETLHEMRKAGFMLPVIVTSGYSSASLPEEARHDPAVDFLAKPFGLSDLCEKVAANVGRTRAEYADAMPAA